MCCYWRWVSSFWLLLYACRTGSADESTPENSESNQTCGLTCGGSPNPSGSWSPQPLPSEHPWSLLGYTGEILSSSPLVVRVNNFMTQAECDAVIEATAQLNKHQGAEFATPCKECGSWWMQEHDHRHRKPSALFDMLEARLGNLTGVPDHVGEAAIKVTSHTQVLATDASILPDAYVLHHEKVGRPRRIATVLIFLSTLQHRDGGHTIFPAAQLSAQGDPVRRAFAAITPPHGKYFQVNEHEISAVDKVGLKSPEAAADPNVGVARAAAEAACRDAAQGTPSAAAAQAVAGSAVIWYHELGVNRTIDPLAWHAGCFVRSPGVTRWALQKFKESPLMGNAQVFLPKAVGSVQVLKNLKRGRFKVLPAQGIAFRLSKDLKNRHEHLGLDQHQIVLGVDEGDWVRVHTIEAPKAFYQAMNAHRAAADLIEHRRP